MNISDTAAKYRKDATLPDMDPAVKTWTENGRCSLAARLCHAYGFTEPSTRSRE